MRGQLLGADLNGTALDDPSPESDCAKAPGGGADCFIVGQEDSLNGSGQVCPLVLQGLDLLVESGELSVALGGELPPGRTDLGRPAG